MPHVSDVAALATLDVCAALGTYSEACSGGLTWMGDGLAWILEAEGWDGSSSF
jgi:hypothetical protein